MVKVAVRTSQSNMEAWPSTTNASGDAAANTTDVKSSSKITPEDDNVRIERQKCLERILSNTSEEKIAPISIVYYFSTVVLSILSTMFITSWPQHEAIGDPTYWYETLILNWTGQACFASHLIVFPGYFCLGIGLRETYKTIIPIWLGGIICMFISNYHLYVFWVYVGGYVWPMPYQGYIIMSLGWWAIIGGFWVHSKLRWKSNKDVTRKILLSIVYLNMIYVAEVTYHGIQFLFVFTSEKWHFVWVLLIILVREFSVRGYNFWGKKIHKSQDLALQVDAVHLAAIRHILFLSVNLGSLTTPTVSYVILASDFIINLVDCFAIIWYHKKGGEINDKKKVGALITLCSNEATEFVLPLAYACVVLISYYGPNAEIMGNIKNSSWQYAGITDINDTIFWLAVMFLVDSGSTIVSLVLLKVFCDINIGTMYFKISKHMGLLIPTQVGYVICEVRILLQWHSFIIFLSHLN